MYNLKNDQSGSLEDGCEKSQTSLAQVLRTASSMSRNNNDDMLIAIGANEREGVPKKKKTLWALVRSLGFRTIGYSLIPIGTMGTAWCWKKALHGF